MPPRPDQPGYIAGPTRAWKRGSFGGDRATARQFADAGAALERARRSIEANCADGTETFRVPDVQGAIGLRTRAYAWTGLQFDRRGPYVDSAIFTRGSMAVSVAVSPLATGPTTLRSKASPPESARSRMNSDERTRESLLRLHRLLDAQTWVLVTAMCVALAVLVVRNGLYPLAAVPGAATIAIVVWTVRYLRRPVKKEEPGSRSSMSGPR